MGIMQSNTEKKEEVLICWTQPRIVVPLWSAETVQVIRSSLLPQEKKLSSMKPFETYVEEENRTLTSKQIKASFLTAITSKWTKNIVNNMEYNIPVQRSLVKENKVLKDESQMLMICIETVQKRLKTC